MVGQVADVLIVWEGDGKGEGIITLPRRSPCDSCTLPIMVSEREKGKEENEGEAGKQSFGVLGAINLLCYALAKCLFETCRGRRLENREKCTSELTARS